MCVFLCILAFILLIVISILLLPINIIIKNDPNNNPVFLFKVLFKTFGENPNPDSSMLKVFKKSIGIDNLEKKHLKKDIKESGIKNTLSQSCRILIDLIKEIVKTLKYCVAKKFELEIVCASQDAAQAAISYGECCAVAYPLVGLVHSVMKVKEKGRKIDISCGFDKNQERIRYNFIVSVKICHVLAALFRIVLSQAKIQAKK